MPSTGTPASHGLRGAQLVVLVGGGVAAAQDDGLGSKLRMKSSETSLGGSRNRHLAAHAARDELGDLGAEIEDEDFVVLHAEGGHGWRGMAAEETQLVMRVATPISAADTKKGSPIQIEPTGKCDTSAAAPGWRPARAPPSGC